MHGSFRRASKLMHFGFVYIHLKAVFDDILIEGFRTANTNEIRFTDERFQLLTHELEIQSSIMNLFTVPRAICVYWLATEDVYHGEVPKLTPLVQLLLQNDILSRSRAVYQPQSRFVILIIEDRLNDLYHGGETRSRGEEVQFPILENITISAKINEKSYDILLSSISWLKISRGYPRLLDTHVNGTDKRRASIRDNLLDWTDIRNPQLVLSIRSYLQPSNDAHRRSSCRSDRVW